MGKGRLPVTGIIAKNSVVAAGFPVNGSLLANEEVDLVAEIVGKVRKIYFQEGVAVKKGQLLLKVDDADLQAQLTRAEFQKKLLAEKLERQRILLKRESISREAFDQLQTDYNMLEADIELLKVKISRTEIRAPFDGVMGFRYVSEGSYVQPSSQIARIVDNSTLKYEFNIPEKYADNNLKGHMKVGTDGVLLGAWADVVSARNILDIGTGTGLISLMMAQRCNARIRAVDIDADAVEQARGNVAASPWQDRIEVELQDICHFTSETLFDVIVSNPPYFTDSLKCPGKQRNIARHTDFLDFDKLAGSAARLLHPEGVFSVIIPADGKESFLMAATRYGLHLSHQTFIHTKPGSEPKRVLLAFKFSVDKCVTDDLTIELSRHVYSEEYIALTKEFYLNM